MSVVSGDEGQYLGPSHAWVFRPWNFQVDVAVTRVIYRIPGFSTTLLWTAGWLTAHVVGLRGTTGVVDSSHALVSGAGHLFVSTSGAPSRELHVGRDW